jgi:hypothetical protein
MSTVSDARRTRWPTSPTSSATGIEILTGHDPVTRSPPTARIDEWRRLPGGLPAHPHEHLLWVDNQILAGPGPHGGQAAAQLARDVRLAHRLGFGFIRPKFGVISPELDPHPTWEETVLRTLDLAAELDVVICPEIHSPTPIKHPVTQNYIHFIERTGTEHFKR